MTEIPDIIGWLGWVILFLLEAAAIVFILCGIVTATIVVYNSVVQEFLDDLRTRRRLSK